MAYIAKTAFETRVTNNEFYNLCNVTGKYQASSADADCSAGLLCVRNGHLPCEGFTGLYNENAWYMNAATDEATADDVIYACNTYETKMHDQIYEGIETLGLGVPAGRYGNFTQIIFDGTHQYRFGEGNLSATLSTNTYFTIDDGLLVPAASAPTDAGSIYFELVETGKFVEGNAQSFGYVQVLAKKVSFAASVSA